MPKKYQSIAEYCVYQNTTQQTSAYLSIMEKTSTALSSPSIYLSTFQTWSCEGVGTEQYCYFSPILKLSCLLWRFIGSCKNSFSSIRVFHYSCHFINITPLNVFELLMEKIVDLDEIHTVLRGKTNKTFCQIYKFHHYSFLVMMYQKLDKQGKTTVSSTQMLQ